jgi:hypothetical protein
MSGRDELIAVAEFSHTVGLIYDCALDPRRWPEAIREICQMTNCAAGLIGIHDFDQNTLRLNEYWNYESVWLERIQQYSAEVGEIWNSVNEL